MHRKHRGFFPVLPNFGTKWCLICGRGWMGSIGRLGGANSLQNWAWGARVRRRTRGGRWRPERRGERERISGSLGGSRREGGERRRGLRDYKNAPSLFFLVPNRLILDTASLVRNLNSKSKSNLICHLLLVPKISRFDLITNEMNSKVDNLIVFGFLLELVLANKR